MLGTDREPGIMARALNDLFYEMDRTKEDMKYKVSMSYVEVRNNYYNCQSFQCATAQTFS